MKKIILITTWVFMFSALTAQTPYQVNNCFTINALLAKKGDTIVINCDSVYVLNKKTYSLYHSSYNRLKGNDATLRQTFNAYESLVNLQSERIEEQEFEYRMLRLKFDSLTAASGNFIGKAGENLQELNTAMDKVNSNLNSALVKIEETKTMIKAEKKNKVRNSLTWGIGGFALGLITCLLIM